MKALIKAAVRLKFLLTSRAQVTVQIEQYLQQYLTLAEQTKDSDGAKSVRVPTMPGVDEDMREWSFFMILEHNVIVNKSISAIVQSLAQNEEPSGPGNIDPKHDVMPSAAPGREQVDAFAKSVETHLKALPHLGKLKGTRTKKHPIFGQLDAHGWNCMFAFHLLLHIRQAKAVLSKVS